MLDKVDSIYILFLNYNQSIDFIKNLLYFFLLQPWKR